MLLILTALILLGEIIRRFVVGSEPIGLAVIVAAIANAATNSINLRLLRAHREHGVHLQASWIFTTNDMIANLGIVASGIAVMFFDSPLPDLRIGVSLSESSSKAAGKFWSTRVKRARALRPHQEADDERCARWRC